MITTKKALGYVMFGLLSAVFQGLLIWIGIDHGEWAPLAFEGLILWMGTALWLALS